MRERNHVSKLSRDMVDHLYLHFLKNSLEKLIEVHFSEEEHFKGGAFNLSAQCNYKLEKEIIEVGGQYSSVMLPVTIKHQFGLCPLL